MASNKKTFNDTRNKEPNLPNVGNKHKLRSKIGALIMTGALGITASSTTLIESAPKESPAKTQTEGGSNQKPARAKALPEQRLGKELSAETWKNLEESSVLIGNDYTGVFCNGRIRAIEGKTYIASAAHCIVNEESGSFEQENQEESGTTIGTDVTNSLQHNYGVYDPITKEKIADLDRVSISAKDKDLFIATTSGETDNFKSRQAAGIDGQPRRGDEAAFALSPTANGYDRYKTTGTDLGVVNFTNVDHEGHPTIYQLRAVGISDEKADAGMGSSGHQPASNNGNYGPSAFWIGDNNPYSDSFREIIDLQLDTSGYPTVSFHIDLQPEDYISMANSLN